MRNIKTMRLSLLVTILSLGLMIMSCSADEVVDCECGTVVDSFRVSAVLGTEVYWTVKIESDCGEVGVKTYPIPRHEYDIILVGDYWCREQ